MGVKGAARVNTSLDAEALAVGSGVCVKSEGVLKLEFSVPPSEAAGDRAVLFKGQAKGEYGARLLGPDGEEAAALTWHDGGGWMALKIPKMGLFRRSAGRTAGLKAGRLAGLSAEKIAGGECMVELRGPAGDVEVRLEGLPAYISAPSGKFFCPARPKAAFSVTNGLLPGGKDVFAASAGRTAGLKDGRLAGLGGKNTAEVTLDGSQSSDLDGDIAEYLWEFGDGTEAKGVRVVKDLRSAPKEFAVTLEVRDKLGFSDSCTRTISVAPAWLLALDPRAVALVEAEDFCGQGVGQVRLYERAGSSGRMNRPSVVGETKRSFRTCGRRPREWGSSGRVAARALVSTKR